MSEPQTRVGLPTALTHRVVVKLALPLTLDKHGLKVLDTLKGYGKDSVVITDGELFEEGWMIVAVPHG
jgi:hypothetical protein